MIVAGAALADAARAARDPDDRRGARELGHQLQVGPCPRTWHRVRADARRARAAVGRRAASRARDRAGARGRHRRCRGARGLRRPEPGRVVADDQDRARRFARSCPPTSNGSTTTPPDPSRCWASPRTRRSSTTSTSSTARSRRPTHRPPGCSGARSRARPARCASRCRASWCSAPGCGPRPSRFLINDPSARVTFQDELRSASDPDIGRLVELKPSTVPHARSLIVLPCPRRTPGYAANSPDIVGIDSPITCARDDDRRAVARRGLHRSRSATAADGATSRSKSAVGAGRSRAGVDTTIRFGAPKGYSQFVAQADWVSSVGTPRVLVGRADERRQAHRGRAAVKAYIFGYASLVAAPSVARAVLRGHRRVWGVAMDNAVEVPGYKVYALPDGTRPPLAVAFLDLEDADGAEVEGALLAVDAPGLAALDARERQYERVDVTALVDPAPGGPGLGLHRPRARASARGRRPRRHRHGRDPALLRRAGRGRLRRARRRCARALPRQHRAAAVPGRSTSRAIDLPG